jgi:hypothetical protein
MTKNGNKIKKQTNISASFLNRELISLKHKKTLFQLRKSNAVSKKLPMMPSWAKN